MRGLRLRKKDSDRKSPRMSCFRSLFKRRPPTSPTDMDDDGGRRPLIYNWAANAIPRSTPREVVTSSGSSQCASANSTDVTMEELIDALPSMTKPAASTGRTVMYAVDDDAFSTVPTEYADANEDFESSSDEEAECADEESALLEEALAGRPRQLGRATTEDVAQQLAEMDRMMDLQAPFPTSPTIHDIILHLESGRFGPNVVPAELMKKRGTDMNDFFIEATDDQLQILECLLLKARKNYFKWRAIAQMKGDDEWFNPSKNYITYTSRKVRGRDGSERWTMPFTPIVPGVGAGPGDEGRRLRDLARDGIPNPLRMKVWLAISRAGERMNARTRYMWKHLATQAESAAATAAKPAAVETARAIREAAYGGTFPTHKWLGKVDGDGPRALERVLLAYSQYNPRVGYCPGMNYVAGMMLISMQQREREAFWMMVALLQDFLLPDYYEGLHGCRAELRVFKDLLRRRFPKVANHLDKLQCPPGLGIELLMTEWFACLWASLLPSETCMRIYDVLFSEGFFIMYGVGLAIFGLCEGPLLDCDNYVAAASLLKKASRGLFNPDALLASAIHELTTFVSPLTSQIIQARAQLI